MYLEHTHGRADIWILLENTEFCYFWDTCIFQAKLQEKLNDETFI